MVLELEDIIKRRDYRLKYEWGCFECKPSHKMWYWTRIFLTRTTDEYERGDSNIKQICLKGHVTKPFKICTKCRKQYSAEYSKCAVCEKHVIKKTQLEVEIETDQKLINRLKSQLKKKKITKQQYISSLFGLEQKIRIIRISLLNLG